MRNNNKIGIVSISEIQGLDFIIPDYQRGYRWEELQVAELLKDLNIFIENSNWFLLFATIGCQTLYS